MRYTTKEIAVRVLEKLGTVLADRRFMVGLITVLIFLAKGNMVISDDELNQWVDAALILIGMVTTIVGWSIRPPSGIKRDNEQTIIVKLDEINTLPKEVMDFIQEQLKQHSLDV